MIKIPEFNELSFIETEHKYLLNGIEIPSVTTLMNPLSSAEYGEIDRRILDKAAHRGTVVHNAIESYEKYGFDDISDEYAGYFQAYKNWKKKYNPEIVANERKVYNKLMMYAGTADMFAYVDGKLVLIDFKTSSRINEMLVGVQLEAYSRAFSSHSISVDEKAILHLKKDGKYSYKVYPKNDNECWKVFSSLVILDNYIKKYK